LVQVGIEIGIEIGVGVSEQVLTTSHKSTNVCSVNGNSSVFNLKFSNKAGHLMRNSKTVDQTALAEGREKYQQRLKSGEITRLNPYEKAKNSKSSLRLAINAECWDCVGRENWHNRVRFCTIFDCALWHVRKGGKGISREQCLTYTEG